MSVQGIVVSENILTLYLHTLMNQRNLVKESHLMIKHLMMLSTGNHEKIGDHYENICWLGWGIPMGLLFSVMFASLQKGMLSGIAGVLLFERKVRSVKEIYGVIFTFLV